MNVVTRALVPALWCLSAAHLGAQKPPQKPPPPPVEQHSITTMPDDGPSTLPGPTGMSDTGKSRLRVAIGTAMATPLRTEAIEPGVPAGLEFCVLDPTWSSLPPADQWYLVKTDNVQQSWGGELTKTTTPDCYQTGKAYRFVAGTHTVSVQLVVPAARIPASADPNGPCPPAKDCYGPPSEILTVISPPTPPLTAVLKTAVAATECTFLLTSDPPDATAGWGVQFLQGTTNVGLRDTEAPYSQSVAVPVGSYSFVAIWTKANVPEVRSPPVAGKCPA